MASQPSETRSFTDLVLRVVLVLGVAAALFLAGVVSSPWWFLAGTAALVATPVMFLRGRRALRREQLLRDLKFSVWSAAVAEKSILERGFKTLPVFASKWSSSSWSDPGVPRVVRVEYPALAINPVVARTLFTHAVSGAFHRRFRVERQDLAGGVLVVMLDPDQSEEAQVPAVVTRAVRIVEQLVPTSTVTDAQTETLDGGSLVLQQIEFRHDQAARLANVGYRRRVESAFNATIEGRWRARWNLTSDTFAFEIRPLMPRLVMLDPPDDAFGDALRDLLLREDSREEATADALQIALEQYPDQQFTIGVDEDQEPVVWHPRKMPHGAIAGRTGTGKTVALRNVVMQATEAGWTVFILDGKGIEFMGLVDWPNVAAVTTTPEEHARLFAKLMGVVEERYSQIQRREVLISDLSPILFVIDEWAHVAASIQTWWSQMGNKGRAPALDQLGLLLRLARTCRVHVKLGIQRPDQTYFGGDQRDNLEFRLGLGNLSRDGREMMWGDGAIGAAMPRIQGRGIALGGDGVPREIQTPWIPDPEGHLTGADALDIQSRRARTPLLHERMVPLPAVASGDALTYHDYISAAWGYASDYPDLDPALFEVESDRDAARAASSAAALFGVQRVGQEPTKPASNSRRTRPQLVGVGGAASEVEDLLEDDGDGYGEVNQVLAKSLEVGSLFRVDEGGGPWCVIEDIFQDEDEMVCIAWRDDSDDSGDVILDEGEYVWARTEQ